MEATVMGANYQQVQVIGHEVWYQAGFKMVRTIEEAKMVCDQDDFPYDMIKPVVLAVAIDGSYSVDN